MTEPYSRTVLKFTRLAMDRMPKLRSSMRLTYVGVNGHGNIRVVIDNRNKVQSFHPDFVVLA